MKKLALISMVITTVALIAVGCSTQGGLDASGSAQTSASPAGVQGSVDMQAGTSVEVQPNNTSTGIASSADATTQ